jgi:hypothetical protein
MALIAFVMCARSEGQQYCGKRGKGGVSERGVAAAAKANSAKGQTPSGMIIATGCRLGVS